MIAKNNTRQGVMNIANMLTITRVIVVFVIFGLYGLGGIGFRAWVEVSFFLFLFGAISDFFDGFFARKYNIQSDFGTCFDPICDKIFVFAMLLLLFNLNSCGFVVIFLVTARELLVSGIREYLAPKGVKMPVTVLAKYKTGFQMTAIGILLFENGFYFKKLFYITAPSAMFFDILPILGSLSLYIATFLTLYTGFLYLKQWKSVAL